MPERVILNATPSQCMPPPKKCIWSRYDLDLWPLTLKTFSAIPIHMIIICVEFHWNPSTVYIDSASCAISVHRQWTHGRTPDSQTDDPKTQYSPSTVVGECIKSAKRVASSVQCLEITHRFHQLLGLDPPANLPSTPILAATLRHLLLLPRHLSSTVLHTKLATVARPMQWTNTDCHSQLTK